MKYMNKSIEELHELLINGKVTSEELVKESLNLSHDVQEKCNAFVTILDDAEGGVVTNNLLSGIPYGIKDNYSTKDILSTGSSNTLKDYVPFFDATAVKTLSKTIPGSLSLVEVGSHLSEIFEETSKSSFQIW